VVPRPDHVVVVIFENEHRFSVIGSPQAPYLAKLATRGANLTQSDQPGLYIANLSGDTLLLPRSRGMRQQRRGVKLPSMVTVPGCSTTSIDHPSSVGRMQPLEADK
jgi:hypothetical protein